ncbi:hypothetical protein AX14_006797 [Amanita brunnescens Koide BX004]|nr:hypothetical protein AX14_006797 [Amanita brunnescens Koide BX004]
MVKLAFTMSLVLIHLALLSQTSVGLPIGPMPRLRKRIGFGTLAAITAGSMCVCITAVFACWEDSGRCCHDHPQPHTSTPGEAGVELQPPAREPHMNTGGSSSEPATGPEGRPRSADGHSVSGSCPHTLSRPQTAESHQELLPAEDHSGSRPSTPSRPRTGESEEAREWS